MRLLKHCIITGLVLLITQVRTSAQEPLETYIQQGLLHNGLIKEQKAWLEEKKTATLLAKKNWSPEINFNTSYTLAAGGRKIAFPIGDLLNPAYTALNQLTNTNQFPQFENQQIQFFPNNFYDVKTRITQPILRPEIKINESLKKEQLGIQEIQLELTKRDLILDIKKAYYQFIQTAKMIQILKQGLVILDEGERVTKSMVTNGVVLPSALLRIQSERTKINTQIYAAENQRRDAREYFNFLIGQAATDTILATNITSLPDPLQFNTSIKQEELNTIDKNIAMQHLAMDIEKKYNAPRLGAQLDLGSQNFNFKWGGYVLGGLQLDIPLWNNKKSVLKTQEILHGIQAVKEKKSYAEQGFKLQLEQSIRGLQTAIQQYHSFTPLLDMNKKYYWELLRKYKEGQATPAELVDAQSQITFAELQQNVSLYQAWIKAAETERLSKATE